jgi:O-methyltransferase
MLTEILRSFFRVLGYRIARIGKSDGYSDIAPEHVAIYDSVRQYTMTTESRVYGLISAVEYLVRAGIPGDIVECGVWRGGSMMAALLTLRACGDTARHAWLYDTFTGMPDPSSEKDGAREKAMFQELKRPDGSSNWCRSELDEVKANLARSGYPAESIHFVPGMVEETIPHSIPERIALLRLDTDWYESTRHELEHLFPRLSPGGVMIVDDYGDWAGSRQAVDEYFARMKITGMLHRLDYSARLFIKS